MKTVSSKVVLVSIIEGSISEDLKKGFIKVLYKPCLKEVELIPLIQNEPFDVIFDDSKIIIEPFYNSFGEISPFIKLAETTLAYLNCSAIVASCLIVPLSRPHIKFNKHFYNRFEFDLDKLPEDNEKKPKYGYNETIWISEILKTSIPSTPNQIKLALWDENELKAMIDYDEIKSYVI